MLVLNLFFLSIFFGAVASNFLKVFSRELLLTKDSLSTETGSAVHRSLVLKFGNEHMA
jgi:hypothetical protein